MKNFRWMIVLLMLFGAGAIAAWDNDVRITKEAIAIVVVTIAAANVLYRIDDHYNRIKELEEEVKYEKSRVIAERHNVEVLEEKISKLEKRIRDLEKA